jgi:preprotein translocase subunit SecE
VATDTGDVALATEPGGSGSRGGRRGSAPGKYYREVVAELRKVIWPSRTELLTYVTVVLVFVVFVTALTAGLDYGFTKAVLAVFG